MATILGPGLPEGRAAADRSRTILADLRAAPFLARLEATLGRGAVNRPGSR